MLKKLKDLNPKGDALLNLFINDAKNSVLPSKAQTDRTAQLPSHLCSDVNIDTDISKTHWKNICLPFSKYER